MKSTINLTGIKALGKHGANPGEQDIVQTFFIDLEIALNVSNDELEQTQDYRTLIELVKRVVEQKQFNLIETLATYIAKKIGSLNNVETAKIVVHKPSASKILLLQDVSAEAVYRKSDR